LPRDEYEGLKCSIQDEGQHYPIILNQDGVVLDGHHRLRVCLELGIQLKFETKRFNNPLLEKKFVIESNLRRRQLTSFQRVEMAVPLLEIEKELAKERQIKLGRARGKDPLVPFGTEGMGKAVDLVSEKIGVKPRTFYRALSVLEKAPEKLKDKVRRGETSISYAYQSVMRDEQHRVPPALPDGVFDVILADPPWDYSYMALDANPEMHYSTMPLDEICSLKVPCADNSILFLWATNPKLKEALKVLEAWGFDYKTNIVWVKNNLENGRGVGHYLKGDHELLLIGRKGNIPIPVESNRPSSVLVASKTGHSRKPSEVYSLIEKMYPNRQYLELFARNVQQGWKGWGDEVEK